MDFKNTSSLVYGEEKVSFGILIEISSGITGPTRLMLHLKARDRRLRVHVIVSLRFPLGNP